MRGTPQTLHSCSIQLAVSLVGFNLIFFSSTKLPGATVGRLVRGRKISPKKPRHVWWEIGDCNLSLWIQSPSQMMIGVYNHLLRKVFRFHYHSQKVIGSLGYHQRYVFFYRGYMVLIIDVQLDVSIRKFEPSNNRNNINKTTWRNYQIHLMSCRHAPFALSILERKWFSVTLMLRKHTTYSTHPENSMDLTTHFNSFRTNHFRSKSQGWFGGWDRCFFLL